MSEIQGFPAPNGPTESDWDAYAKKVDDSAPIAGKEYQRALQVDGGYIWSIYCFVCQKIFLMPGDEIFSPFKPKPCPECGGLKCSAEVQLEKKPPELQGVKPSLVRFGPAPEEKPKVSYLYRWTTSFPRIP